MENRVRFPRQFLSELTLFCICFFFVLGVWLFLGWNPDLFLGNNDFIFGHYPITKLMMRNHFHYVNFSETILAGAYISPVTGSSWVLGFFYALGFDAASILNASLLLAQTVIVFYCHKLYEIGFDDSKLNGNLIFRIFIFTLTMAFNPIVMWRVEHGHLPFIWAVVFFLSLLVFIFSIQFSKRPSVFLSIVLWLGLCNTLTQQAYQIVFYGSLACILIFFVTRSVTKKKLLACAVFFFSIFLYILPEFKMLSDFSKSEFSSRSFGVNAVYSYYVSSFSDLDTIFVLNKHWLADRNPFLHHELHYPIVFPIVLLFLFRNKINPYFRKITMLFSFAAIFTFILSCKPPFLGSVVESMPFISSFRLIGRANIVLGLGLYLLLSFVLVIIDFKKASNLLAIVFPLLFFRFLPDFAPYLDFAVLFLIVAYFLSSQIKNLANYSEIVGTSLKIVSVLAIFVASQSISVPKQSISEIENKIHAVTSLLRENGVGPNASIVYVGDLKNVINLNLNMALDQKGVEGYWQPTPAFNRFYSETIGQSVDPTRLFFPVLGEAHLAKLNQGFPTNFTVLENQGKVSIVDNKNEDKKSIFAAPKTFTPSSAFVIMARSLGVLILLIFIGLNERFATIWKPDSV